MEPLPHHYTAIASGDKADSHITVTASGLPDLTTNAPAEFGGPGNQWSPESLLMAAVADCFVLTFRAIAQASKLQWDQIQCQATGTLDRIDRKPQFTEIQLHVTVTPQGDISAERVQRLLEKAEDGCLITNSLSATVSMTSDIQQA
ncbi:OsmC family protein [Luminiphilus sp. nBUS_16]|uniref:OsmC family protein n=1 Tax=unclassified Luminiphilus TaxID=2633198 RepID=UPI003EBA9FE6|nr:OsmC family protein [Luminiphilus sp.]|tara:strand:+ start:178 stop:615 length:438 start_codon:yes stop_codon:yes gene_type:complete